MKLLVKRLIAPVLLRAGAMLSAFMIGAGYPTQVVNDFVAATMIVLAISVDLFLEIKREMK